MTKVHCILVVVVIAAMVHVATAQLQYHEYNVAIGARHQKHKRKNKPNCSRHEAAIQARIDKAVQGFVIQHRALELQEENNVVVESATAAQEDSNHRELSQYNNPDCRKFCHNVARGYCYIASGGLCAGRRRQLRRSTPPRKLFSNSFLCSTRTTLVKLEMLNYAISLNKKNKCREWLIGPWDYSCLVLD